MFLSCLCLRHGTYLNGTSYVFAYLLIIFLGHAIGFSFSLINNDALDSLRNDILSQMTRFGSNLKSHELIFLPWNQITNLEIFQ